LAADVSGGQPQCAAEAPCGPLGDLFAGVCGHCCPCWAFSAEGIVLQRGNTRSQTLFEGGAVAPVELLNAHDLNFPVEVGPQVSAIHQVGCTPYAVEVAYFQVDGFAANRSVPGTSMMVTDVNGPFFTVNDATARYTSAIYMGEVNLRWQWSDWLTLLSGFRMGQLDEHYHAAGTDASFGGTDTLDVAALNNLYGLQLGADADVLDFGGPLQVKAMCRAGMFANFARQDVHRVGTDPNGAPDDDLLSATRSDHLAFLGQTGVVLTYAITPNLAFRATVEAMWLEGVALAPEQIGTTDFIGGTATVDASGGIFYYGGGMGLEYRF
jgi:hypothetical protein